jgi:hypothetical protein
MTFNQHKFSELFENVKGRKPTEDEIKSARFQQKLSDLFEKEYGRKPSTAQIQRAQNRRKFSTLFVKKYERKPTEEQIQRALSKLSLSKFVTRSAREISETLAKMEEEERIEAEERKRSAAGLHEEFETKGSGNE